MRTLSRTVGSALAAAIATAFVPAASAQSAAHEWAAALDKAIPAAMGRASIPGAIVGIGRTAANRTYGRSASAIPRRASR